MAREPARGTTRAAAKSASRKRTHGAHEVREAASARYLHFHRFLLRLALSAGNIFAWVFVFRMLYDQSLEITAAVAGTAILYALSHGITFTLTPLSSAALRSGIRRSIVYGAYAAALAYAALALAVWGSVSGYGFNFLALSLFVVGSGIHRALYWIPYNTIDAQQRVLRPSYVIAREVAIALMPAAAGYLVSLFIGGPATLVLIAMLIILSTFPLSHVYERHERFEWSYSQTLAAMLKPAHERAMLVYVLDGIQGAALLLVWPLAVFLILGMSIESMGVILTATLLLALVLRYYLRRVLSILKLDKSTSVHASLAFSAWVLRLAAASPVQILAVDTYYQAGNPPRRFSVDQFAFDQYADAGHYVDEYTALKEMGLSIGRVSMALFLALLSLVSSEAMAFSACIIIAALAAAASIVVSRSLARTAF